MPVPPLHQCILHASIPGVTFQPVKWQFDGTHNVQHRNRYKCGNVKPNGYVQVALPSFEDGCKHVPSEYHPDNSDGNIDRPDKFCILRTVCKSQRKRDGCCYDDELPSPEMDLAQYIAVHPCLAQALQRIINAHENTVTYKCKNHRIGMQGPQPAETTVLDKI